MSLCAPPLSPAGTLAKPFFKRYSDGSFVYESGGARAKSCQVLPRAWLYVHFVACNCCIPAPLAACWGTMCLATLPSCMQDGMSELGAPNSSCKRFEACFALMYVCVCVFDSFAEARDDDDGMSMLVDLAGAAANRDAAAAAAGEGEVRGGAVEEGARIKVTFPLFQVRCVI